MFIYISQTPPNFQFTKKSKILNSKMVYLVVCGCLLVVCGRLPVVCGHLVVICGCLMVVCGCLLVVCSHFLVVYSRLLVVCDSLCLFVEVCGRLWSLPVLVTTVFKSNRLFGTKHSKVNQLQRIIEYKTNEESTKYSN